MQQKVLFSLLLKLVLVSALWAQPASLAPAAPPKSEAPAKASLKIPVWVEKEEGVFWEDGKRQSFKVFLEDKEIAIKSFQHPKSSTVLLVVFDTVAELRSCKKRRCVCQCCTSQTVASPITAPII